MTRSLTIGPAAPQQLDAVLHLVLQDYPEDGRFGRVAHALDLVERGELDPDGILAAHVGSRLVGGLVCQRVPGSAALFWPPQAVAGVWQRQAEDRLVEHARHWLKQRGAKLAQALLHPERAYLGEALVRNGFRHVTRLDFLRHFLDLSTLILSSPDRLTYESYRSGDQTVFHSTLLRTYVGTSDCPEITGCREVEEIISGHQAQGIYNPERWWLALDDQEPIGVLMMTEMEPGEGWEVSYVGVTPEARGRGYGCELMARALLEARVAEMPQVTLSVDARNRPAINLYSKLGFEAFDCREVFLAIWHQQADRMERDG